MDKLFVSANYERMSIEFDKIYYVEDLQNAISRFYDYLKYNKELEKCVQFVNNNSSLLQFMFVAVRNNVVYFVNRNSTNKVLSEYTKETFPNFNAEQLKMLNKNMSAETAFSNMLKKEFLKVKPLMVELNENIMDVLKEE